MKFFYFAVFGCALVMFNSVMPHSTYSTMYDHINVDDILKNDRLFNRYFTCLTKKEGCTPDGKLLAAHLPDALRTNCSKCSEKQKEFSDKVIRYLIDNKPEEFAALTKKYDPEGIYKTTFGPQFKKDNTTTNQ
ncbi:hypothetical protein LSTR_LSTR003774 [Laodelphax striatellus]|uniref:Uncharacterized protein n=1 Tax=Laodelphax striatellus TaxID=195883 RepID=A0A482WP63_LAOST|nr:hypothetical protein LSTR_LSTR003774 [Laodelphax striatellus]